MLSWRGAQLQEKSTGTTLPLPLSDTPTPRIQDACVSLFSILLTCFIKIQHSDPLSKTKTDFSDPTKLLYLTSELTGQY
jgi:hypothetical protein